MTKEEREMLNRINAYADEVMPDIDPQKVPVSEQLAKLRPIFRTLSVEQNLSIEEIFIKYMDLASEAAVDAENKLQESLTDLQDIKPGDMP